MTTQNQDFSLFAGDGLIPTYTILDGSGNPLPLGGGNVTQITWTAQRNLDPGSPLVLTKTLTGSGISIVGDGSTGKFAVTLTGSDTAALTESYWTVATITDSSGTVSTVANGQMTVRPKPLATYSGDPSTSNRDFARMLVGDTNMDAPKYPDQAYDALATKFGGPLYVAAQVCRMLAQSAAGMATKRLGDLSIDYGSIAKAYSDMAADYQARADISGGGIGLYASGISWSDMKSYRLNPDAVRVFTTLDAFDNRGGAYGGFAPINLDGSC